MLARCRFAASDSLRVVLSDRRNRANPSSNVFGIQCSRFGSPFVRTPWCRHFQSKSADWQSGSGLLGVQSREVMVWIWLEAVGLVCPVLGDELERGEPLEGLQAPDEVVGVHEGGEVSSQTVVAFIVIATDGGVLQGAVHAFDLAIGPWVVGLCQAVLDAMHAARPVKRMAAPAGGRLLPVPGQVGELDAIVGQDGMDRIEHRFDEIVEESDSRLALVVLEH